jgi:hypothetical protein
LIGSTGTPVLPVFRSFDTGMTFVGLVLGVALLVALLRSRGDDD